MDLFDTFVDGEDFQFIEVFFIDFKIISQVGSGAFSRVFSATDLKNRNRKVAIKVIDKKLQPKCKEAEILAELDHPNILKYYQTRESLRKYYLITELIQGCRLEEYMKKSLQEDEIRNIISQILDVVNHIHYNDIIHRDIKPENILINETNQHITLIDFGLSYKCNAVIPDQNCGTLIYMAPEMTQKQHYTKSVDIWSVGIIQYMLFTQGVHPIWEENDTRADYFSKLTLPLKLKIPPRMSRFVFCLASSAQNFLHKSMSPNHESRMTALQALSHPWISGTGELCSPITMADMIKHFEQNQRVNKILKLVFLLQYIKQKGVSKFRRKFYQQINHDFDPSPSRKLHKTQDKFNLTELNRDVSRKSSLILINMSGVDETEQDSMENEKRLSFVSSPQTNKNCFTQKTKIKSNHAAMEIIRKSSKSDHKMVKGIYSSPSSPFQTNKLLNTQSSISPIKRTIELPYNSQKFNRALSKVPNYFSPNLTKPYKLISSELKLNQIGKKTSFKSFKI